MAGNRTSDDVVAEIKALQAERDDLLARQTPVEEVRRVNDSIDSIRRALEETSSDIDAFREEFERDETRAVIDSLRGRVREALESEEAREVLEGVDSGLEQASAAMSDTSARFEQVDQVVDRIETLLRASDADAASQIEELAAQFEDTIELLGPLLDRLPIIGQFLRIYAMAIRNIAKSVGKIQEVIAERNRIWGILFPGERAYRDGGTWQSRLADRIRDLDLRIAALTDEAVTLMRAEELPVGSGRTEVDVVLKNALNSCRAEYNAFNNGPESNARAAAKTVRDAAAGRMEYARGQYQAAVDELSEAETDLDHSPRNRADALELNLQRVEMARGAVHRAREALAERSREFDDAQARFTSADVAYQAQRQIWLDGLRQGLLDTIPLANRSQGFTAAEFALLDSILRHDHYITEPLVTAADFGAAAQTSEVGYELTDDERAELISRQEAASQRREAEYATLDAQPDRVWDPETDSYRPTERSGGEAAASDAAESGGPSGDEEGVGVAGGGLIAAVVRQFTEHRVRSAVVGAGAAALIAAGIAIAFIGGGGGGDSSAVVAPSSEEDADTPGESEGETGEAAASESDTGGDSASDATAAGASDDQAEVAGDSGSDGTQPEPDTGSAGDEAAADVDEAAGAGEEATASLLAVPEGPFDTAILIDSLEVRFLDAGTVEFVFAFSAPFHRDADVENVTLQGQLQNLGGGLVVGEIRFDNGEPRFNGIEVDAGEVTGIDVEGEFSSDGMTARIVVGLSDAFLAVEGDFFVTGAILLGSELMTDTPPQGLPH